MLKTEEQIKLFYAYATLVVIIFIVIILLFIVFYRNRRRFHRLEKEALQDGFKNEIINARLEVQENTLQHISREIHDNIGQQLAVVRICINRLESQKKEPAEKEELVNISKMLGDAIGDLRAVAHTLNADFIAAQSLVQSLQQECNRINQLAIVQCVLTVSGDDTDILNKHQELLLFRIYQEFIQNSITHGECTAIDIRLTFTTNNFSMCLVDNGKGFDLDAAKRQRDGTGLKNIMNRVQLLQGNITVQTDKGTRMLINIPVTTD